MLDERTVCLLKIINERCAEGSFKVITMDELVLAFPKRYQADGDLIRKMLNALNLGGYLSLRYDRDNELCLAPTPKGRQHFEEEQKVSKIKKTPFSVFLPHFYDFLAVFFGVALAVLFLKAVGL